MQNIRDIMTLLRCNMTLAREVFDRMGINGLDFSECTKWQFKAAAWRAIEELNEEDMQRAMAATKMEAE